jgi:large subunit ribosomal protein L6
MSRIGKQPITIPKGVDVSVSGSHVTVKGPNGTLERDIHPEISLKQDDGVINVERPSDARQHRALHGLTRTLVANMVEGVTSGFRKVLEIQGVGYRAAAKGKDLEVNVGFSHPVLVNAPAGITFTVETPTRVVITGANKEAVGQVAADIRSLRPPDPYKGKGIRYEGEYVRRKAGKAAK